MRTAEHIADNIFNPDDFGEVYTAPDGRSLHQVCADLDGERVVRERNGIGHRDGRDVPPGGSVEFWFKDGSRIIDSGRDWDCAD